jgi:hypothetical protein
MSGNTNFPTALDDNTSLIDVTDGVSSIAAAHHNNLKEAVKALEAKVGIFNTGAPTSLDYRLGHPTSGHTHDGASGNGGPLSASALTGFQVPRHIVQWYYQGSVPSGASLGAPVVFSRTMQLESVNVQMRRAPSGATAAFDVNFGPTSVWVASQGLRPILPAGTATYAHASPNLVTYPSGTLLTIDADKVGTNEPGSDVSIVFIFKE